jgi:hypothetical protein
MVDDEWAVESKNLPPLQSLQVEQLGTASSPSPLIQRDQRFADEAQRVLLSPFANHLERRLTRNEDLSSFEPAGPRRDLYFQPERVSCGIVTCGGLCPGLNDVIRSIVLTLTHGYGDCPNADTWVRGQKNPRFSLRICGNVVAAARGPDVS